MLSDIWFLLYVPADQATTQLPQPQHHNPRHSHRRRRRYRQHCPHPQSFRSHHQNHLPHHPYRQCARTSSSQPPTHSQSPSVSPPFLTRVGTSNPSPHSYATPLLPRIHGTSISNAGAMIPVPVLKSEPSLVDLPLPWGSIIWLLDDTDDRDRAHKQGGGGGSVWRSFRVTYKVHVMPLAQAIAYVETWLSVVLPFRHKGSSSSRRSTPSPPSPLTIRTMAPFIETMVAAPSPPLIYNSGNASIADTLIGYNDHGRPHSLGHQQGDASSTHHSHSHHHYGFY